MLPERIREFLAAPRFSTLVLVDGQQPRMFRCMPKATERGVTVIVPRSAQSGLDAFTTGTHRAAVVVSSLSFEAYQIKGPATVRAATPEECAHARDAMVQIGGEVERLMGIPKDNYANIDTVGSLAVDVIAELAYEQTPKPGAGAPLAGAR